MIVEANAKQIENFALEPVRRRPNAGHTINTLFRPDLQPDSLILFDRKQVVDDLKRLGPPVGIVHARQIRKVVEARVSIGLEKIADLDDALPVDVNRKLSDKLRRF